MNFAAACELDTTAAQFRAVSNYFDGLATGPGGEQLPAKNKYQKEYIMNNA